MLLCSGCSVSKEYLPAKPVILDLPNCPRPKAPLLPLINGKRPLDSSYNVEIFLERDDIMRLYIKALDATIDCYQSKFTTWNGSK